MARKLVLRTAALVLLAAPAPAPGIDGDWDYTFGTFGRSEIPPRFLDSGTTISAMAVQPDGRILVFGTTEVGQTVYGQRLEPDGRVDLSFYFEDFLPGSSAYPVGAAVLADGRVLLAGVISDGAGQRLIAWMSLANGLPDPAFGDGGRRIYDLPADDETPRAVALGPGGTLLIASDGYNPSPFVMRRQLYVTRLLVNGDPDPSWSFSGHRSYDWRSTPDAADVNRLGAIALEPDGQLMIAGSLLNTSLGTNHAVIGRLGTSGAFDSGFGTSGRTFLNWSPFDFGEIEDRRAFGVARLASGSYLVGANFYIPDHGGAVFGLARLSEFGGLDSTYGTSGYNVASYLSLDTVSLGTALAIDAGGAALVGGKLRRRIRRRHPNLRRQPRPAAGRRARHGAPGRWRHPARRRNARPRRIGRPGPGDVGPTPRRRPRLHRQLRDARPPVLDRALETRGQ
jgi:uncharacterized delta-60 repeat protein